MATVLSFIDGNQKSPVKRVIMRARCRGVNLPRTIGRFSSYDARKLLTPVTIARIETRFHLPADRTEVQSNLHYQSTETPNELDTWGESSQQRW